MIHPYSEKLHFRGRAELRVGLSGPKWAQKWKLGKIKLKSETSIKIWFQQYMIRPYFKKLQFPGPPGRASWAQNGPKRVLWVSFCITNEKFGFLIKFCIRKSIWKFCQCSLKNQHILTYLSHKCSSDIEPCRTQDNKWLMQNNLFSWDTSPYPWSTVLNGEESYLTSDKFVH